MIDIDLFYSNDIYRLYNAENIFGYNDEYYYITTNNLKILYNPIEIKDHKIIPNWKEINITECPYCRKYENGYAVFKKPDYFTIKNDRD